MAIEHTAESDAGYAEGCVVMERLEKIRWHRTMMYPAGDTLADLHRAAAWVRAIGHEAGGVCEEGFRYRSIYAEETSRWQWIEPGQWLVHMEGENQAREFDLPSDDGPALSDDEYYGYRPWPSDEWHLVYPSGDRPTPPAEGRA